MAYDTLCVLSLMLIVVTFVVLILRGRAHQLLYCAAHPWSRAPISRGMRMIHINVMHLKGKELKVGSGAEELKAATRARSALALL